MNDTNWREEMKSYTTSKFHLELLENGPKSLSQSWILQSLYQKWRKIKGIKDDTKENEGQLQSSFKEFESRVNQLPINPLDTCNGSNEND